RSRQRIEDLHHLLLRGKDGAIVKLEDVADIGLEMASNLIARENTQRKAVISCNIAAGHNLGDVVQEVRRRVDPIVHSAGYSVVYGGQFEAQQSASRTIMFAGGAVVIIMFMLLVLSTGTLR